jgi:hypothetical protein
MLCFLHRFSKKNMMLVGLWCSDEKPPMNVFLRPLLDSLNELYVNGKFADVIYHNGQLVIKIGLEVSTVSGAKKVKAAMVVVSCDLPARALVLNMRQFNGQHGCHLCEDPGENSHVNPMLRWWPYNEGPVLRTKTSLLKNALDVAVQDKIVSSLTSGYSS